MLKKCARQRLAVPAMGVCLFMSSLDCLADDLVLWAFQKDYTICQNDTHNGKPYFCLIGIQDGVASPEMIVNGQALDASSVSQCKPFREAIRQPYFPQTAFYTDAPSWYANPTYYSVDDTPVWCYDETKPLTRSLGNGKNEYRYPVYRFPGYHNSHVFDITTYPGRYKK